MSEPLIDQAHQIIRRDEKATECCEHKVNFQAGATLFVPVAALRRAGSRGCVSAFCRTRLAGHLLYLCAPNAAAAC